jgi:hypothetical protein
MKSYSLLILDTYVRRRLDNELLSNRFMAPRMTVLMLFRSHCLRPLSTPLLAMWVLSSHAACEGPEERSSAWEYVHTAILRPACSTAGCHSAASAIAGLDLSTPTAAYSYLLGRACGAPENPQDAFGNYVVPFEPERSRLLYLLRGDRTTVMPPDTRLPNSEIAIVERWILEGAACE